MTLLRRISPASAFKVGFICYAFLGLILGAFCTLIAVGVLPLSHSNLLPFGRLGGILAIVLCPVMYGLMGGIGALVAAAIYNLASGLVGGLEVEIR